MSDHWNLLVEQVQSSAQWRASKADQYPDDKRNVRSSQALTKLAERLEKLPADDVGLAAYDEVMDRAMNLVNSGYEISEVTLGTSVGMGSITRKTATPQNSSKG